jgi:hypothetical protein
VLIFVERDVGLHLVDGLARARGFEHCGMEILQILPVLRRMGLGPHRTMTRDQNVELELLDLPDRLDPVRKVRVRKILVRQPRDRDEVDREHGALVGEAHHDQVVRVTAARVDQLHRLATELDGHLVREGDVGHGRWPLLPDDRALGVVVCDHDRLLEHLAAGDVVSVIMAVDHVSDGLLEAFLNLVLQPCGGLGVDRVRRDDAFGRDQENRNVKVVLEPI